jgi:translation initiation factor 2 beta subunit (eIF-2beta)/eIF-5
MDAQLLSIKAIEQKIVDYLNVYKKCKTVEEKQEIQHIIQNLEIRLAKIRK